MRLTLIKLVLTVLTALVVLVITRPIFSGDKEQSTLNRTSESQFDISKEKGQLVNFSNGMIIDKFVDRVALNSHLEPGLNKVDTSLVSTKNITLGLFDKGVGSSKNKIYFVDSSGELISPLHGDSLLENSMEEEESDVETKSSYNTNEFTTKAGFPEKLPKPIKFEYISKVPSGFLDVNDQYFPIDTYYSSSVIVSGEIVTSNGSEYFSTDSEIYPLEINIGCQNFPNIDDYFICEGDSTFYLTKIDDKIKGPKINLIPINNMKPIIVTPHFEDEFKVLGTQDIQEVSGKVRARLTSSINDAEVSGNINLDLVSSYKNTNLNTNLTIGNSSSNTEVDVDSLFFTHYFPQFVTDFGYRKRSSTFSYTSSNPISNLEAIGVWVGEDSRRLIGASDSESYNISVYMPSSGDIRVYRGDSMIYARAHDAGNQFINTSLFPAGNYEVKIVRLVPNINNLPVIYEFIYNSKNRMEWTFGAGYTVDTTEDIDIKTPFFGGAYPLDINNNLKLSLGAYYIENRGYLEFAPEFYYKDLKVTLGTQVSDDDVTIFNSYSYSWAMPWGTNSVSGSTNYYSSINSEIPRSRLTSSFNYSADVGFKYLDRVSVFVNYNEFTNEIGDSSELTTTNHQFTLSGSSRLSLFGLPVNVDTSLSATDSGETSISIGVSSDFAQNSGTYTGNVGYNYGGEGLSSYLINIGTRPSLESIDSYRLGLTYDDEGTVNITNNVNLSSSYASGYVSNSYRKSASNPSDIYTYISGTSNMYFSGSNFAISKESYESAIIMEIESDGYNIEGDEVYASMSRNSRGYILNDKSVLPMKTFQDNEVYFDSPISKLSINKVNKVAYPGNVYYQSITSDNEVIVGLTVYPSNFAPALTKNDKLEVRSSEEVVVLAFENKDELYIDLKVPTRNPMLYFYYNDHMVCAKSIESFLGNNKVVNTGYLYIDKLACDY